MISVLVRLALLEATPSKDAFQEQRLDQLRAAVRAEESQAAQSLPASLPQVVGEGVWGEEISRFGMGVLAKSEVCK